MIRISGIFVASLLLALAASGDTFAQTKKKDPRCVPNFFEACQKRCLAAGGRVHLCPSYCEKKKYEYGCG